MPTRLRRDWWKADAKAEAKAKAKVDAQAAQAAADPARPQADGLAAQVFAA